MGVHRAVHVDSEVDALDFPLGPVPRKVQAAKRRIDEMEGLTLRQSHRKRVDQAFPIA